MPPTAELAAPATGARPRLAHIVFPLAGLFLWSQVLQAPVRYGLAQLHLDALIYLPKLLLVAAVLLLPVLRPRVSLPALSLTALAGLYLLWGAVNLPSLMQALFGLWVMVPLLFGLWAGPIVHVEQWQRLFVLLFLTAAVGVFLNPLVAYPWSGQSLSLLGEEIELSRQWSTSGFQRYSGFARASFSAAAQLLLFGLMLVALLRRRSARLLAWLIAGAGIALTTSKGPLGAWLILSLYLLGGRVLGWPRYWVRTWVGLLGLILLAMTLLPLSTLWVQYDSALQELAGQFLFASFGDRLNAMWPASLRLLDLGGAWHWWVGRGLGGIGSAQQYFEPANALAGDNLFVYVTVITGLPVSLFLFAALWLRTARLDLRDDALDWRFPVILALVAYGLVATQLEGGLLAFFLGVALAAPNGKRNPSERA